MMMEYQQHRSLNNMNKFILTSILLFCFFTSLKAQECGTEELSDQEMEQLPWFGNPDYLYNFLDSLNLRTI